MNLELKTNQHLTVDTSKGTYSGSFQGFTVINQIPHLVLVTTTLEKDLISLIPVLQVICYSMEKKGTDRL